MSDRVWYEGIDGRFHEGLIDDNGGLTVTAGHTPAEGREVYHERPEWIEPEDLCPECLG